MGNNSIKVQCWFSNCNNAIREEDKKLKTATAKLCEEHNKELNAITDSNNIGKLISFMLRCNEKLK